MIANKFPTFAAHPFFKSRIGVFISILITQYLVFFAWIAFRVKETNEMLYSMKKFVLLDFQTHEVIKILTAHKFEAALIILFVILHLISYRQKNLPEKIANFGLVKWTIFLVLIMLSILFFYDLHPEDFIYFKF